MAFRWRRVWRWNWWCLSWSTWCMITCGCHTTHRSLLANAPLFYMLRYVVNGERVHGCCFMPRRMCVCGPCADVCMKTWAWLRCFSWLNRYSSFLHESLEEGRIQQLQWCDLGWTWHCTLQTSHKKYPSSATAWGAISWWGEFHPQDWLPLQIPQILIY